MTERWQEPMVFTEAERAELGRVVRPWHQARPPRGWLRPPGAIEASSGAPGGQADGRPMSATDQAVEAAFRRLATADRGISAGSPEEVAWLDSSQLVTDHGVEEASSRPPPVPGAPVEPMPRVPSTADGVFKAFGSVPEDVDVPVDIDEPLVPESAEDMSEAAAGQGATEQALGPEEEVTLDTVIEAKAPAWAVETGVPTETAGVPSEVQDTAEGTVRMAPPPPVPPSTGEGAEGLPAEAGSVGTGPRGPGAAPGDARAGSGPEADVSRSAVAGIPGEASEGLEEISVELAEGSEVVEEGGVPGSSEAGMGQVPPPVPAGEEKAVPPVPAGEEKASPPPAPAAEEKASPPPVPAGEEKASPPPVPAGEEKASPPPVPAGEERASPPPVPARDEGAPAAEVAAEAVERKFGRPTWYEDFFDDDFIATLPQDTPEKTRKEVEYLLQELGLPPEGRVLDLGCGFGRHAVELAARGYSVVGLDRSLPLLLKAGELAQQYGVEVEFLQEDMRRLDFQEEFDGIYCMATTFGYFSDEENRDLLRRIQRALKPGGRFVLDVVNRDYILGDLPQRVWWEGDGCLVMEEMEFNYFTSRIEGKRTMVFNEGRQVDKYLSVRVYSLHELGQLLHGAELRVLRVTGHLATRGRFFGMHSPQLIITSDRRK